MKCLVMPVIIGTTGTVSKSLTNYLEAIAGQHSVVLCKKSPHYEHHTS
jgi:hypothetical protein